MRIETITRKQAVKDYTGYSCIGLYNPKGPENVGAILRAAGCYGVNSVFYTGKRYERAVEFRTDTKQVHLQLPLIGVDDLQQVIPSVASRLPSKSTRTPNPSPNTSTRNAPSTSSGRKTAA